MNGIVFNNIHSDDLDIIVSYISPATKPKKRVDRVRVPGRDGTLSVSDGTYDDITIKVSMLMTSADRFDEIKSWLSGSGDLITRLRPDRKFHAAADGEAEITRIVPTLYALDVNFTCHPFAYDVSPETHTYATGAATLVNQSVIDALPTITFSGTIVINGVTFVAATELTVDVENMLVYKYVAGILAPAYLNLTGDIALMRLVPGENTITVTGAATIQPNWRWI